MRDARSACQRQTRVSGRPVLRYERTYERWRPTLQLSDDLDVSPSQPLSEESSSSSSWELSPELECECDCESLQPLDSECDS